MRFGIAAWAIGLVLVCLPLRPVRADAADLCRTAIVAMERAAFIPDRLMMAVAVMESGRRGPNGVASPWPWTINVEGVGEVFESKQAAIAAVQAHQARGARSIDVGCMQVNLMHHPRAFPSLDLAFEPASNVRYAATFLQQLLAQTGSWPRAVAGYHSLTPEIGGEYARKVLAIWAKPELGRPDQARTPGTPPGTLSGPGMDRPPPSGATPPPGLAGLPSIPAAGGVRILPAAGSGAPGMTGRGLDSYRAAPTRLATSGLFRRG